ncbi:XRE family transcriptional regulator [Streptomyces sp. MST-110588]|uniref:helix-turn-helix domain-containing protein n=1 Tax=Streptomyces sp. MST-110588 TaxID=2833628 RepID=UPI001F5D1AA5|nr:XRE family transcriptional regulator [Streptomyces sp. MST-110588]UNO39330.1 helix-turn-helix domain-containing protein [Streptomyces sp. MST-110588]
MTEPSGDPAADLLAEPGPGPAPHSPAHPSAPAAADPPTDPAADLPSVAPRLRDLRQRSGLTLEAAARRVGLSPAHLSRLETNRRQPSLPVLLALARTYGTTVSDLLGEAAPERNPIVRADRTEPSEAGGWTYWTVGAAGRAMQALRVHVPQRAQGDLVRVHPGEEWLYVLKGRLRLILGEAVHVLEPGDAAHFDSTTPHRITAASPGGADLLFVHTLLRSGAAELCLGDAVPRRGL